MIDDEVKEWLIKAESDFKVIEHELKLPDDEMVKDAVCFHCQQAVEKYLKAFLIHHKIHYEKTHNIEYLLVKCGEINNDFKEIEVENISRFAVIIRYAEDFYLPNKKEVKFYYDLTKRIKEIVFTKLKINEQ
jgi:HEPN domain-containing protein